MRNWCSGIQLCAVVVLLTTAGGCASHAIDRQIAMASYSAIPRELDKTSHPPYRVEPPDILNIEAVNNIRPANSVLQAGDTVTVRLQKGLEIAPEADAALSTRSSTNTNSNAKSPTRSSTETFSSAQTARSILAPLTAKQPLRG